MPDPLSKGERRIQSVLSHLPSAREQLLAAISAFGEEFDAGRVAAKAAGDPADRNLVAALERDFEVLVNWLDGLAARGLAEAIRRGVIEKTPGTPFERLAGAGAISARSAARLTDLRRVRDELQHAYVPEAKADLLHEGVSALLAELDRFLDRYASWAVRSGIRL